MMGDLEKELIGMRGARQVQGPTQKGRPVQLRGNMLMIMIFQFKIIIILHPPAAYHDDNAKVPGHKHFCAHSHIDRFSQLSAQGGSQGTFSSGE